MNIKIFFAKMDKMLHKNKAMLRDFCIHQQDNLRFVVFLIVVLIKAEYGSNKAPTHGYKIPSTSLYQNHTINLWLVPYVHTYFGFLCEFLSIYNKLNCIFYFSVLLA